jgi:DNA-binding response OmpR family regulator
VKDSGADELLVKPVSPKALHAHISRIVLRQDHPNQTPAVPQSQKTSAEQDHNNGVALS